MRKYGYVVVEGPHDVEFVYRLLSPFGFKRVQWMKHLDPFMSPLVPTTFPHGGDLQKRVPVPLFLQNQSHAVAVRSAIGDSRLVETLDEGRTGINLNSDFDLMTGVGVILDTDREIPAADRYKAIKSGLAAKGFTLPNGPGTVATGPPRIGAFVLPDNNSVGNLEDLLIECATTAYPSLLSTAKTHVEATKNDPTLQEGDGEDLTKTPVYNKAVVGSIGAVLRPGKAVQVSLQDNRWLRDNTLQIPRVKAVQDFLVSLLDLV